MIIKNITFKCRATQMRNIWPVAFPSKLHVNNEIKHLQHSGSFQTHLRKMDRLLNSRFDLGLYGKNYLPGILYCSSDFSIENYFYVIDVKHSKKITE